VGNGRPKVDRADTAPAPEAGADGLEVSISAKATEVADARAAVEAMPDTRIDRVQAIQVEVVEGSYHRDSQVIAKKMVDESLRESLRSRSDR
jgi:flagellar biosynthesis anti-sigma factor FlgM